MKRLATRAAFLLLPAGLLGGLTLLSLFLAGAWLFTVQANPGTNVGLDTDTTGNTPTSLGTLQMCRTVNNGQSFSLDLFVQDTPALRGWEAYLDYDNDPPLLSVTGNSVLGQFLSAGTGSDVESFSDPVPDSDGLYFAAAFDWAGTPGSAESGDGVLDRLTFQAHATNDGIANIDLFFTSLKAYPDGAIIPISREIDATIGVGVSLPDSDLDSHPNPCDNCPNIANPTQSDTDDDGLGDPCDNCPAIFNPDQADFDHDGTGDACEDSDGDGIADSLDNCPAVSNPSQTDTDTDGQGDACDSDDDGDGIADSSDNCPLISNPTQTNTDGDSLGDPCDPDDDEDGFTDVTESARSSNPLDISCLNAINNDPADDAKINDGCPTTKAGIAESGSQCDDALDNDGDTKVNDGCPRAGASSEGSTPEVCDGSDNDGDGAVDEGFDYNANTIPDCTEAGLDTDGDTVPNPADTDDDSDGNPDPDFNDGFVDAFEGWMGTDSLDACPDNTSDAAWPSDFNNSGTTNITDIVAFRPVLGTDLGGPDPQDRNYDRRYDLNGNAVINITDIVAMRPTFNTACTN